jgi:hypothetical protein
MFSFATSANRLRSRRIRAAANSAVVSASVLLLNLLLISVGIAVPTATG